MSANKAILGAILAGLAALLATLQAAPDSADMRAMDWVIIILSAVVTGMGVYLVPNRPVSRTP
jgi:hypothetical protein